MRIVFFGTPDFAVPSLRAIQEEGHLVLAVVTQPDRPAGRGRKTSVGAVKREAAEEGIEVLQPEDPNDPEVLARLREMEPELFVVVAYGRILSQELIDIPTNGTINVHASLLPELRGAGPVNWAIIRGNEKSGVTIMKIVPALDAGPILYRVETRLPPDITAGDLGERLSEVGAAALVEALAQMESGVLAEVDQDESRATYAPKLDRDTARIDWSLDAPSLDRWIRGCDPWPGAWTRLGDDSVQMFSPSVVESSGDSVDAPPGTVVQADPRSGLRVATSAGLIDIAEVKPAGRSRMPSRAWVAGRGVATGDRFA